MKKILPVLIVLLVCIPLAIAIISYVNSQGQPSDPQSISNVSLTDLSGKVYSFSSGDNASDEDMNMIQIFLDSKTNAARVSQLPLQLNGKHYVVTFQAKNSITNNFYYTSNPEICYYTDDNFTYKLSSEDAARFLETPYAHDLFSSSLLPVLSMSGNSILPHEASWYYKATSNTYLQAITSHLLSNDVRHYDLVGGFGISFDKAPDYCQIIIIRLDTEEEVFSGTLEQLAYFDLSDLGTLNVHLDASWGEGYNRGWYGQLSYECTVSVEAPANFLVHYSSTNQVGDLITVTARNVTNLSEIEFSSTISLPAPKFFSSSGEEAYAIIAIPFNAPVGEAKMTFTYNGISQSFTFKVEKRATKTAEYVVKAAVYNSYYNDTVINTYKDTIAPYLSYASSTLYCTSSFAKLFDDSSIKSGYGRTRTITSGTTKTDVSFLQETIQYKAAKGSSVCAVADGEVIYSGYLEFSGYIVIIEHGYGLKSWYLHMDSTTVSSGTLVTAGDQIGVVGSTGFFGSFTGVEFGLSIFDQFFCPYDLWKDGEEGKLLFP